MTLRAARFDAETSNALDLRTPFQVDRDRVLYCPHLARLAEVTQVRSLDGGYLVHNRLTHSLKVAQLARRIAEKLRATQPLLAAKLELNEDVAETAGLAHDMGHPPFGHIAESELNHLVQGLGQEGYEGNAQTFRILVRLSIGDTTPENLGISFLPGLNQTRASLNAVLKYPWFWGENPSSEKKWGCYETERAVFEWARVGCKRFTRSVEAEIMDWADDITYAIHDMTDFYCANLIPLHLLCPKPSSELSGRETDAFFRDAFNRRPEMLRNAEAYKKAFNEALRFANIPGPYQGTQSENRDLWAYSSVLITNYIDAITLADPDKNQNRCVQINENAKHQTSILKELTWKYVILHNELATIQYGQRKVIRELFEIFQSAAKDGKLNLFPVGFHQLIANTANVHPARWAADYISGMTEREVARVHHRLTNV